MSRQPMSPGDAVWFHMDGPANTAVITSILLTGTPLDFDKVRRVYTQRLARFERFSQRVVEAGLPFPTPHWESMPGFAIGQQMHRVALPPPGDDAALAELISDLASTPLDHARPLWDVHVVDGVGNGSALITRMHHCMGDGTANVLIARTLFGATSDETLEPGAEPASPLTEPGVVGQLFAPMIQFAQRSARQVRGAVRTTVDAASHPEETLRKAGFALAGAGMLATELLRTPDPRSPLKGEFGLAKRVAWSAPVALADVKAIGAPLGAKINDVLVAGMTGALRTYLQRRGVDVSHTTVCAMVPVDLRPPERADELGNHFGVVLLDLAITHPAATAARARHQGEHGWPEALARAGRCTGVVQSAGARTQGGRRHRGADVPEQGERGHDQRGRPAGAAAPGRRADRACDVLGAAPGQGARHGHQHPELLRHGHTDSDRRCAPSARPGSDHAGVQPRVRGDAEGGEL